MVANSHPVVIMRTLRADSDTVPRHMHLLLTVEDALTQILVQFNTLSAESIELSAALNRVLAEEVVASSNIPPFATSSMDGFAVRSVDTIGSSRTIPADCAVTMDIPAGQLPAKPVGPREAARIMTGALLPESADAVVPVEDTDANWSSEEGVSRPYPIRIFREVRPGDYVRPIGEDIRAGQIALRQGTLIGPAEIGVLASLGIARPTVVGHPRVAIIATGNELVDVGLTPAPGQIRDSNSHILAAMINECGGLVSSMQVARDTLEDVRHCFQTALRTGPHLVLSSAGVSVGVYDVVRTVVQELGTVQFWKVNIRPGKPLAFGRVGKVPFVGLPGNPVSAMVTFELFVRPALLKMAGRPNTRSEFLATVGEEIRSDGRRSYLRVTLKQDGGNWIAYLTGTQSSGALMSMVKADGLLIVPDGVTVLHPGDKARVRLLRHDFGNRDEGLHVNN